MNSISHYPSQLLPLPRELLSIVAEHIEDEEDFDSFSQAIALEVPLGVKERGDPQSLCSMRERVEELRLENKLFNETEKAQKVATLIIASSLSLYCFMDTYFEGDFKLFYPYLIRSSITQESIMSELAKTAIGRGVVLGASAAIYIKFLEPRQFDEMVEGVKRWIPIKSDEMPENAVTATVASYVATSCAYMLVGYRAKDSFAVSIIASPVVNLTYFWTSRISNRIGSTDLCRSAIALISSLGGYLKRFISEETSCLTSTPPLFVGNP